MVGIVFVAELTESIAEQALELQCCAVQKKTSDICGKGVTNVTNLLQRQECEFFKVLAGLSVVYLGFRELLEI